MDAKAEAAVESVREGCVCDASLASPWRGNVSRGVLTRHWVLTHSELAATLPAVTRMEERQRERDSRDATEKAENDTEDFGSPSADTPVDGDAVEMPFADSHAFLVVQLLLKKYGAAEGSSKTAEHAVGQFIYRWRSSFVDSVQPQDLPRGWMPEDGILRCAGN